MITSYDKEDCMWLEGTVYNEALPKKKHLGWDILWLDNIVDCRYHQIGTMKQFAM